MSVHASHPTGTARRRVLLLGGVRSGRTRLAREFAEEVDTGTVWFVSPTGDAAGGASEEDPRFEDGRWQRVPLAGDHGRLVTLIEHADPADTLVVDDVDGWLRRVLMESPADLRARVLELVDAVEHSPARLILVSHEIGLGVPASGTQALADAVGAANRRLAEACEAVALVVAGQPLWIKPAAPSDATRTTYVGRAAPPAVAAGSDRPTGVPGAPGAAAAPGAAGTPQATAAPGATAGAEPPAGPVAAGATPSDAGEEAPMPDEQAAAACTAALAAMDLPGRGLGRLSRAVSFAAAVQGTDTPAPFRSPRAVLLHGDDEGSAAAGHDAVAVTRRMTAARFGEGPLAGLADRAGVRLRVVDLATDAALERTAPLPDAVVDGWVAEGASLADSLVDGGADLVVLAADGAGLDAVAGTVIAALTGSEITAMLPPVLTGSGEDRRYDDEAWMRRCVAARDALYRLGYAGRDARTLLRTLAGPVIATATGLLLQATRRRTPVLLDGPVGLAAALLARAVAGQSRHWLLLPDAGHTGAVPRAADVLDVPSLVPAGLEVGEGGGALALLPLVQSALALAAEGLGAPAGSATADAGPAATDRTPDAPPPTDRPPDALPPTDRPLDALPPTDRPLDAPPRPYGEPAATGDPSPPADGDAG